MMNLSNNKKINKSFFLLKQYCESENFKGWDPYDGLNSKVFKALKMDKVGLLRLVWIQFFKRSPINFRKLMLVEKDYNPKGLGLFLTAYCNLYKVDPSPRYLEKIIFLANKLIELKSDGYSGACWGYNFDWQSRVFFLPKSTPTVVATSFISYALMDAYDITQNEKYLETAISSCDFILNDLHRTKMNDGFIFSYSPYDDSCIYNASLLGSRLLARVYSYTKNYDFIKLSKKSIQACVNAQRTDGAWTYGSKKIQNWVDSFHTGYNLECIAEYQKYSGDLCYEKNIELGLSYYIENFFLDDGTPKYFDSKTYPIDIHSPAQFIVTIYKLDKVDKYHNLIEKVLNWTINNMQNEKSGYFKYQLKPSYSSAIPYMRWAEAWMFYSFSFYFLAKK